jgi:hypothetical protein
MPSFSSSSPDWVGRGVGLLVFVLGIGLLVAVFVMTNRALADLPVVPAGKTIDWGVLGARLGTTFARLLLLGFVASWIAGRGAQLYAASSRGSGDE